VAYQKLADYGVAMTQIGALLGNSDSPTPPPSRYVVGIDLGTTNSAVSYVDTAQSPWKIESFFIPQITAPGTCEALDTLPSFHYEALPQEIDAGVVRLPWTGSCVRFAVGSWARDAGALLPGRLISSAKSWLCHSGIDRTAAILPWRAADDVERLSPVEVSARFLRHIHDAWNYVHPDAPLSEQEIVLTIPASFDEIARQLTLEAARRAGLPRVVLIEEPQAAFYAWIYKHRHDWQQRVAPGQTILVCDIGGGTTDFTLIRVQAPDSGDSQAPLQFHRVAVGEHLLLGGDNLDLYLARFVEQRMAGQGQLPPRQWDLLVRQCRLAKEILLSENAPASWTLRVSPPGTRLIADSINITLSRDEVRQLLLDGFLPQVSFDERPQARQSGFQEFGLPYAPDPAVTRYLAEFLRRHAAAGRSQPDVEDPLQAARPDLILFNGGFFNATCLQQRLLEVLRSWFAPLDPRWQPTVLAHDKLHLAVANGAAYYAMVRRGEGVRINANLARSYYIGVAADRPLAVCLVPGDAQPGSHLCLDEQTFQVAIAQPVEFPLYVSSTRLVDRPGEIVEVQQEQLRRLPPIRTVLRTQRRSETGLVPVALHAQLTEIGTLELWCAERGSHRSWRLEFDVRTATQSDVPQEQSTGEFQGVLTEDIWHECARLLAEVFGPQGTRKPERLMTDLSSAVGMGRDQWPPTFLRRLWQELMVHELGRRKSPTHEARWLNLVGFALRPGYGVAVDDWRVGHTWRTVFGKLAFQGASRNEGLILWRRIAGGLTAGQQQALLDPLLPHLRQTLRKAERVGRKTEGELDPAQIWYTAGALEWLDSRTKCQLAEILVGSLRAAPQSPLLPAWVWALGRLAQRQPSYGPLNTVVEPDRIRPWLETLMQLPGSLRNVQFAVMLAARRTGDRYRDIPASLRQSVVVWLQQHNAREHLVRLVEEGGQLEEEEQAQVFGELLPLGLRLC